VYHPVVGAQPPEGLAQYALPSPERAPMIARALVDDDYWLDGTSGNIGYRRQIGKFFDDEAARAELLPVLAQQSLRMRPAFIALAAELIPEITARAAAVPRMAEFPRPVTVAFGADDPYLNLAVAADFAARFPTSRRVDIAGGNHYVQVDRPGEVAEAILSAD
jgi:pimeloyl-ACP methyl ester carboxylesterase